ncbi:MAG TPA: hypothetical protein V6D28_02675 [Leptolyngbyaceae cyanobacterium]
MTNQLEQALVVVYQLPDTEQDAIASMIIEKIAAKEHTIPTISPSNIQSLQELYAFREPAKILHFLDKLPFLVPVLLEVPNKIGQYFRNYQLFLEVVNDPEIIDYQQLFILISTNISTDEAMDKLDRLENDWWLNIPYEVRDKLCIDVEYQ